MFANACLTLSLVVAPNQGVRPREVGFGAIAGGPALAAEAWELSESIGNSLPAWAEDQWASVAGATAAVVADARRDVPWSHNVGPNWLDREQPSFGSGAPLYPRAESFVTLGGGPLYASEFREAERPGRFFLRPRGVLPFQQCYRCHTADWLGAAFRRLGEADERAAKEYLGGDWDIVRLTTRPEYVWWPLKVPTEVLAGGRPFVVDGASFVPVPPAPVPGQPSRYRLLGLAERCYPPRFDATGAHSGRPEYRPYVSAADWLWEPDSPPQAVAGVLVWPLGENVYLISLDGEFWELVWSASTGRLPSAQELALALDAGMGGFAALAAVVIRRRARRRARDWGLDEDDLTQDAIVAVLQGDPAKMAGAERLLSYLTALCDNVGKRAVRKRRRQLDLEERVRVPEATEQTDPVLAEELRKEREAEAKRRHDELVRAIKGLPAGMRTVAYRRWVKQMPAAKLARRLGITEPAVNKRLAKARERLMAKLGKDGKSLAV